MDSIVSSISEMNEVVKYLFCFLVSMIPLIELRGAIPISQALMLPVVPSFIVCMIGNMIPVPIIYFFARKVLIWGKDKKGIGKFFTFCLEKGEKGGKKLMKNGEASKSAPWRFRPFTLSVS